MLLGETPTTKLLWLYLRPKGLVSYSTRKLAAALYLSQPVVSAGLGRLRGLGLLEDVGEQRARVRPVYRVVDPGGSVLPQTSGVNGKEPPPLPAMLERATPVFKLVHVYLEPYGAVGVLVRGLEVLLGISH